MILIKFIKAPPSLLKFLTLSFCGYIALSGSIYSQELTHPTYVMTGKFLGETPPLRDLPPASEAELEAIRIRGEKKLLNPDLKRREYPFADIALPKGPDPVWQQRMGDQRGSRAPMQNFGGQTVTSFYPPDANGAVGPSHYMQTVNVFFAIYSKSGALVAGPTPMNALFNGVTGSDYNDGDPIVLYDEQADRWFAGEFSITGGNDYMLMAVSTTNDPTGTWYAYSFDVADMPDYMKFGVWRDGYYMATNTSNGSDIYVFERSQMLIGGTARGVAFDNLNRPTTIDGFVVVPPLDNDGTFAPEGSPGLFIAFNDDAIGGGSDELWLFELDVDWATPTNSTFGRTQQISVAAFNSNFGTNWDNIAQPNTTRELDAIPMVIMNVPQYRNFGTHQTIVCCHTVDVDDTDHAGIRWYELQKTTGSWTVRQQGTYAPDGHSRWMASISMNANHEIGLGYSISSSSVYPGIRYCGQSAGANAAANGLMDIPEEIIQTGGYSQTVTNRWGDYSGLQVDPTDDETFWYTTEYISSSGARATRIASFQLEPYTPGLWTGTSSSSWSSTANWDGGVLPTDTTTVVIPSSASNWPVFTGDFTIGTQCSTLILNNNSQMTIQGSITISKGNTLDMTSGGTLNITGNWTNNGNFIEGTGTVAFTGNTAATVNEPAPDASNYNRSTFNVGMTEIPTTNNGPSGDDASAIVPIGFTFNYCNNPYTSVNFCTNGWISLNQTGANSNDNTLLFTESNPNTTLAPWWDNLRDDNTSHLYYITQGNAPNRIFTAEWNQVVTYLNPAKARISFQVKLYETTNAIEFHYGAYVNGNHSGNESASIGIEDGTGGSDHFLEATTGSSTTGVTNLVTPADWPAVNYRFAPPTLQETFNNVIINNAGGNVTFNVNTTVNGEFTVMPGASFNVATGRELGLSDL